MTAQSDFEPHCIASTGKTFCTSVAGCNPHREELFSPYPGLRQDGLQSNCFRSAQISADGSTIVTYSEDQAYRSFILPPTLLDLSPAPHPLPAYSTSTYATSHAFALYPYFDLSQPSSTLALVSQQSLPIRLTNILDFGFTVSTYSWVNEQTEAFVSPASFAFTNDATHFVAGTNNALAIFDLQRNGEGPVEEHKSRRSARARKMFGVSHVEISGIINALAIDPSSEILAAGSTNRQIALFEGQGRGACAASFELREHGEKESGVVGNGVSQIKWSGDGRYLFVAERQSDALLIYDVRVTGKRMAWLQGRKAKTPQRLGFDLADTPGQGVDLWAGGTDGIFREWKNVTSREGPVEPDGAFRASSDTISSVLLHPTAHLLVTTSGQRLPPEDLLPLDDSDTETDSAGHPSSATMSETGRLDNTLNVWAMSQFA
ncbi:hypothetical protein AAFC00_007076 [Neodothiora populina]|uniref:Uncharacterized protein n=1 Tax=Neodothiora populina TaxID=2781224 RepID=A0ABR3PC56_9PEZI